MKMTRGKELKQLLKFFIRICNEMPDNKNDHALCVVCVRVCVRMCKEYGYYEVNVE